MSLATTIMKTSEKLSKAADILAAKGMVSGVRRDHLGRHCALGALDAIYPVGGYYDSGYHDEQYADATAALADKLRAMEVPEAMAYPFYLNRSNDGSLVAQWSNRLTDEDKSREVIGLFRMVASALTAEGK